MSGAAGTPQAFAREDMVEAVAMVRAIGDFVGEAALADVDVDVIDPEVQSNVIALLAQQLQDRLFGARTHDSEEALFTDADEVEILARSSEIQANLFEEAFRDELRSVEASFAVAARTGRVAQLREYAPRVRAAGTIEVSFPTVSEISDIARGRMNGGGGVMSDLADSPPGWQRLQVEVKPKEDSMRDLTERLAALTKRVEGRLRAGGGWTSPEDQAAQARRAAFRLIEGGGGDGD